jgi:hypothetical protein
MKIGHKWAVTCVATLGLQAGTAMADGMVNPRICKRHHLSEATQRWCESIEGLSGRALYKATVLENLRRTNQPPAADLKLAQVLPRRIDLDATGSTDDDGFPELFTFQLFDGDTGPALAGPVTTRNPTASLKTVRDLPGHVRAVVVVEDDERAVDTAELAIPLGDTVNCSNFSFACSTTPESTTTYRTTCSPLSDTIDFGSDELLDAAQRCDPSINGFTWVIITAAGAEAGGGANISPSHGGGAGAGGKASLQTTIDDLDSTYGSPASGTTYCYGIGHTGGYSDTGSGGGGASTILRTCQNVSQTERTGVLLIAGGGGGGAAANFGGSGHSGGAGGTAVSTTGGSCPPSCVSGNEPTGSTGGNGGGAGGSSGNGGAGDPKGADNDGNDGIGGEGGYADYWGAAGFSQGEPMVSGSTGQGGSNDNSGGGAGGGGWGGGGAGSESGRSGGGGGGSYAAQSTQPLSQAIGTNQAAGFLIFNFYP